jgi:hypothetical protein
MMSTWQQAVDAARLTRDVEDGMIVREPNGSRTIYTAAQVDRIIDACCTELAMNFDVPAMSILGWYGAKLGITAEQLKERLAARCDRV